MTVSQILKVGTGERGREEEEESEQEAVGGVWTGDTPEDP